MIHTKESITEEIKKNYKALLSDVRKVHRDSLTLLDELYLYENIYKKLTEGAEDEVSGVTALIHLHVVTMLEDLFEWIEEDTKKVLDIIMFEDVDKVIEKSKDIANIYEELAMRIKSTLYLTTMLEDVLASDTWLKQNAKNLDLIHMFKDMDNIVVAMASDIMRLRDLFKKVHELTTNTYMNLIK